MNFYSFQNEPNYYIHEQWLQIVGNYNFLKRLKFILNIKMNRFSFKMIFCFNSYFLKAVPKKLFKINSHSLNSCFGILRIDILLSNLRTFTPKIKCPSRFRDHCMQSYIQCSFTDPMF